MLSHLRFHRRGPSNPTSPIPESTNTPWDAATLQPKQLVPDDGAVPAPAIELRTSTGPPYAGHGHGLANSPSSQVPPQPQHTPPLPPPPLSQQSAPSLPPIARIASSESDTSNGSLDPDPRLREDPKAPQRTPYNEGSGFIGGLALQNYRREQRQDALRPPLAQKSNSHGKPSLSAANSPTDRNVSPSFLSPTEHASSGATGRRPLGARLHSDIQAAREHNIVQEAARDRRGIPFLKNPISNLLLRRKTSQNVLPELSLPLRTNREEPSYQPIRGTRVHDFSAPRAKRVVSASDVRATGGDKPLPEARPPTIQEKEYPPQPAPPVPAKENQAVSVNTSPSVHSKSMSVDARDQSNQSSLRHQDSEKIQSSIPSSISTVSRNASVVSGKDMLSSLPKHMKSTSSRFSFDMLGAANAEKALEEKHRLRQQEKAAESPAPQRDSRFDDFDEDSFDYDAMDYDDGLEEDIPMVDDDYDEEIPMVDDDYDEEIPMVNNDYDEEDVGGVIDPDNDQDNFAGFVFQRSDPVSSLTSPLSAGMLPTPRDIDGNIIGYAISKESPEVRRHSAVSMKTEERTPTAEQLAFESPTGLGIQGLDIAIEAHEQTSLGPQIPQHPTIPRPLNKDDELYFGGLGHEFEGEGDGRAIDESLFDLDDTDKYGRPIPGMFASALAQRMSTQEIQNREPDEITTTSSVQPEPFDSTDQPSHSGGVYQELAAFQNPEEEQSQEENDVPPVPPVSDSNELSSDTWSTTQAALAEAVQNAAASGKFRRGSSPPLPTELTITSPTTVDSEESGQNIDHMLENMDNYDCEYDDDFSGNGLDDYELDDDPFIAEANASALAGDEDGWYGSEFGFYSAPLPQIQRGTNASTEENPAFGGYFGPNGVSRTKSGHLVSREPNLTPITERSEYSNRNSIMSLQMPNSAGREAPLQSPGLAQLAMMAEDDNMTLSALLKLRSRAWGGSQASLVSSREGSPSDINGASSPLGQERDLIGIGPGNGRRYSTFSLWSAESGAGSGSGSPTLTMAMAGMSNNTIPPLNATSGTGLDMTAILNAPLHTPPPPPGPNGFSPVLENEQVEEASVSSPSVYSRPHSAAEGISPVGVPSQICPVTGHRHRGSADSISYYKEEESGATRWVMERRRTAESGEIEILGREIVEGGKI